MGVPVLPRAVGPGELEAAVLELTGGAGADAVVITAASSDSRLIEVAGEISRIKGRVLVIGLVGMNLPRDVFSCSLLLQP